MLIDPPILAFFLSNIKWHYGRLNLIYNRKKYQFNKTAFAAAKGDFENYFADFGLLPTVMSFDIRQKKGQNRGVEWSKLTLSKCAVEGLNCREVDNFEF